MEVLHKPLSQEERARRLMARREANLFLLQKEFPQFYKFFTEEKGKYSAGIQISTEGQINLIVNGIPVYNRDPYEQSKDQFEEYTRAPKHLRVAYTPDSFSDFREYIVDHRHAMKIYDLSPLKGMHINQYYFDKTIGVMMVFGVGLGYHLEMLAEHYDIKNLIIVDADPEVIKVSLYTIDWVKILRKFTSEGRMLTIITGTEAQEIANKVIDFCRSLANQSLFFCVHFYIHVDSPVIGKVLEILYEKFTLLASGWGFFNDEYWSLEQTIENIRMAIPVLTPRKVSKQYPVFIVGSGPSLDESIKYIRENQQRAIIVSCGSSISSLQKYGIKPDFHVEIERTETTYKYLVEALDEDYLSDIRIIANNPMHPSVFTLGKEQYMFLKPNDTGALLFEPSIPRILYANPTVVNGGLALFLHMGFENIYLFGTDMGFKDPERHHSSGHLSLKKGSSFYQPREGYDKELEGNFGGKVLTNRILFWAKDAIERLLMLFPKAKVYNLSDGARIIGTIPLRPERLRLSSSQKEKEKIIEETTSLFSEEPLRSISISGFLQSLKGSFDRIIESAERLLENVEDRNALMTALSQIYVQISGDEKLSVMLRGGYLINQSTFLVHAYAIEDREKARDFVLSAKHIIVDYLRECRAMLDEIS